MVSTGTMAMAYRQLCTVKPFRVHAAPVTAQSFQVRNGSSQSSPAQVDVEKLLATPTWSVESLMPTDEASLESPSISSKQLHHLLRLSALPPPATPEDEARILKSLSSHLHFVNAIRKVDTTGVKPLQSLRDETAVGNKEEEVGLEDLKDAFAQEEMKGKYYKRIRRKQEMPEDTEGSQAWDVLGSAEKRVGRYFVVEGGKAGAE